uniref:Cyclin-dependent kinase inhibitor n=1 Tax=Lotus japonicus TaxID=34305 RepID=I3SDJ1_LOTJA|nr:unknown [Lotus japonicus]
MAQLRDRVRTRSALLSMEPASAETSSKRSKIAITTTTSREELLRFSPSSSVQLESTTSTSDGGAPPPPEQCFSGATSDELPCCSSNEKTITKFSDPEVESARAETASCDGRDEEEEETTRKREMSTSHGTSSQEVDSVEEKEKLQKMPTESELEEFFSAAEKDIQKRFSHKYNYDIVKDVPLEGRYEWVQLKP